MYVLDVKQLQDRQIVTGEGKEVHNSLVNGSGLVIESEQIEVGEEAQTLEIIEESRVEAEPLNIGAELGHQLQVVGAQQLHRVEEDCLEAEHREDRVRGVEVDVGKNI